eukprot:gnl/TRDRNA2_/TRDRNA2_85418_c0_seq1.p1 gnl/TRDRNA2_/TRDRNA2_85418_c0~~gnl/TRDRNA2_/TRDRNA2_85418_c0_seq1.p1  ORF type:complete len:216 (+),score=66.17 gnl/TRDRNA2_/TRDRNA2_85418_c0_seq1:88-735(+)
MSPAMLCTLASLVAVGCAAQGGYQQYMSGGQGTGGGNGDYQKYMSQYAGNYVDFMSSDASKSSHVKSSHVTDDVSKSGAARQQQQPTPEATKPAAEAPAAADEARATAADEARARQAAKAAAAQKAAEEAKAKQEKIEEAKAKQEKIAALRAKLAKMQGTALYASDMGNLDGGMSFNMCLVSAGVGSFLLAYIVVLRQRLSAAQESDSMGFIMLA